MACFLRTIRKNRWLVSRPDWLPEGDIPADPLSDLSAAENALSVWYVSDSSENLERVVAALASTRDKIDKLDYVLIEQETIHRLGIIALQSEGKSPDDHANRNWHYDFKQLSGGLLVRFVKEMLPRVESRGRILDKRVEQLIREGIASTQIDEKKLNPRLKQKLGLSGNRLQKLLGCFKELFRS